MFVMVGKRRSKRSTSPALKRLSSLDPRQIGQILCNILTLFRTLFNGSNASARIVPYDIEIARENTIFRVPI
jgi:hypothetical protein